MKLTHGSLFSGIGGFDRGAQLLGIETLWNCEVEPYNRLVLKKHFPKSIQYEDIRCLNKPQSVAIISGGFPCQDLSTAGKGRGITGEHSGLWFEMFRIVDEVRPQYVVIENSPVLLRKGFERVLHPLSEIGYDAEWQCLSARTFGDYDPRERLYVIAYATSKGRQIFLRSQLGVHAQKNIKRTANTLDSPSHPFLRFEESHGEPPVFRVGDGLRKRLDILPRLAATGNAVKPHIAHYLFDCIQQHHFSLNTTLP